MSLQREAGTEKSPKTVWTIRYGLARLAAFPYSVAYKKLNPYSCARVAAITPAGTQ